MRYATDQVFKPLDPMRPVDTAQAFAVERKHKPLKILGITFGAIIALLLIAYAGVALYFTDRFMPNSNIGDINVSLMSAGDAEKVLVDSIKDYALSIDGQGFSLKLTASGAGLSIDEGKVVRDMLSDMNPWAWPFELQKDHDETAKLVATYNGTGLEDAIRSAVAAFNEGAAQPVNATIGFDDAQASFVIKPEAVGTALDADAVIKAADEAVADLDPQVKLTSEQLLKPTVLSTDPKLTSAADSANTMIKADLELLMAGTVAGTVDASLISQWVSLDDELAVTLDEGALTAWVDELAAVCNTVGTQRTYTRSDGKVVTVAGGLGCIIPPSIPLCAVQHLGGHLRGRYVHCRHRAGPAAGRPADDLCGLLLRPQRGGPGAHQGGDGELRGQGFLRLFLDSFWALLTPVIILGSIYGGIATPTEAAVISVYYALFVSVFIYKTIKVSEIPAAFYGVSEDDRPILFVLSAAVSFGRVLALMNVPQMVGAWITSSFSSKWTILLVVNIFLLFVGMVMDAAPAI